MQCQWLAIHTHGKQNQLHGAHFQCLVPHSHLGRWRVVGNPQAVLYHYRHGKALLAHASPDAISHGDSMSFWKSWEFEAGHGLLLDGQPAVGSLADPLGWLSHHQNGPAIAVRVSLAVHWSILDTEWQSQIHSRSVAWLPWFGNAQRS